LNNHDAYLQQCFFGEFLLSLPENNSRPVAIVKVKRRQLLLQFITRILFGWQPVGKTVPNSLKKMYAKFYQEKR